MSNLRYSAPFALIGGALVSGIVLADQFAPRAWALFLVLVCAVGGAALAAHDRRAGLAWSCALCAICAAGALRFRALEPAPWPGHCADDADLPNHSCAARDREGDALIEGIVDDDPAERPDITLLRVRVSRALINGADGEFAPGALVLIRAPADPDRRWRYGDVLRADGRVAPPPRIDGFDYRLYLARQGVRLWMPAPTRVIWLRSAPASRVWDALFRVKHGVRMAVRRVVPAPESALLNGILIGDDDLLPAALQRDFRRTGTSHIISISGFNVGVIVGAIVLVASRWVHPRRIAPFLLVALWLYAAFVGGSASVVRAVAMASLSLCGQLIWRRGFTLNTVCAAATVLLFVKPAYAFDIGFQLSVGATLGLVLLSDPLATPGRAWVEARIRHALARKVIGIVLDGVLLTLAAQLMTLPILVNQYRELSLISLLSNALILPLQPPIMGLGALAAAVGAASTDAGRVVAVPVFALLRMTTALVSWTAPVAWAVVPVVAQPLPTVLIYYGVIGALGVVITAPAKWRRAYVSAALPLLPRLFAAVVLVCALPFGMDVYLNAPDGRFSVRMTGTSALLTAPDGARVLLLGEGDIDGLTERAWTMRRAPFALVVVASLDAATLARGERVLRAYGAQLVVLPAPGVLTDTVYLGWRALAPEGVVVADAHVRVLPGGLSLRARAYDMDALGNRMLGLSARFGSTRADFFPLGAPPPVDAAGWRDWRPGAGNWLCLASMPPIGGREVAPHWLIRSSDARRSIETGRLWIVDLYAIRMVEAHVINERFIIIR